MTEASKFIDYYELLEISPNANSDTIERMFRYFAQRYHPDNQETGDRQRFDLIMEAHDTLKDPAKRAQYDIQYRNYLDNSWKLIKEASDGDGIGAGVNIQDRLLLLLYVKRRQNTKDPGIGNGELERLLGCPAEHLEFDLWYLKEKAWIERTEIGTFAITADGVDRVNLEHRKTTTKFLMDERRRA